MNEQKTLFKKSLKSEIKFLFSLLFNSFRGQDKLQLNRRALTKELCNKESPLFEVPQAQAGIGLHYFKRPSHL